MPQDLRVTRVFAKSAIAKGLTDSEDSLRSYVGSRWPGQESTITRAALGDIGTTDVNSSAIGADVLEHVIKQTVLGQMLRDVWPVGFEQVFNGACTGLSANWVAERNPGPISRTTLDKDRLARLKVMGLSVFTVESLQTPNAEAAVERALVQVCRDLIDETFLSGPGFAAESPQSIPSTAGVVSVGATADPAASLRSLIRNFNGQLSTSYLITDTETAAQLALYPNSPFLDAGVTGGTIAGLPLVVSESSPRDSSGGQVVLLDASRVAVALGAVEVSRSNQASILMGDQFDSNGPGGFVSLFQNDAVALKIVIACNWKLMAADACRVMTGADW